MTFNAQNNKLTNLRKILNITSIINHLQRIKTASHSAILYINVRWWVSKLAFLLGTTAFVTCKLTAYFQSQPVRIFCRPRKLSTNPTARTATGTQHFNHLENTIHTCMHLKSANKCSAAKKTQQLR